MNKHHHRKKNKSGYNKIREGQADNSIAGEENPVKETSSPKPSKKDKQFKNQDEFGVKVKPNQNPKEPGIPLSEKKESVDQYQTDKKRPNIKK